MGLVIPGFVPSPLGEVVDYVPSFTEFCVSAGIWAMGALIYTLLLKAAIPIELGELRMAGVPLPPEAPADTHDAHDAHDVADAPAHAAQVSEATP
jgi:hypothetical protein